jgi:hypothetical protein
MVGSHPSLLHYFTKVTTCFMSVILYCNLRWLCVHDWLLFLHQLYLLGGKDLWSLSLQFRQLVFFLLADHDVATLQLSALVGVGCHFLGVYHFRKGCWVFLFVSDHYLGDW